MYLGFLPFRLIILCIELFLKNFCKKYLINCFYTFMRCYACGTVDIVYTRGICACTQKIFYFLKYLQNNSLGFV